MHLHADVVGHMVDQDGLRLAMGELKAKRASEFVEHEQRTQMHSYNKFNLEQF
jgi:hypothetical protein